MNKITGKQIIPHLALRCIEVLALILMTGLMNASAQIDTVNVPSDVQPGEGNLNKAIAAAITSRKLAGTVFELEPGGCYILNGTIIVPRGEHLTIVAPEPGKTQDKAPPQIVWSSSAAQWYQGMWYPKFSFDCDGDITLKNVWLLYANTEGVQVGTSLQIEDNTANIKGQTAVFEGVIFDYSCCPVNASGAVGVTAKHFRGTFRNCYFRNCIDTWLPYYGRAVSFPCPVEDVHYGWHIDSLLFENCTFANMGTVYSEDLADEYADVVRFNHCTFLNTVLSALPPGCWYWLSVTNSIFINTNMFGHIPGYNQLLGRSYPDGGTFRIDSVANLEFNVSFTEKDRHILFANSSYFIEEWLVNWMHDNPYSNWMRQNKQTAGIPVPQPMLNRGTMVFFDSVNAYGRKAFPYINRTSLYDSTDPGFILPPTSQFAIERFLYFKWDGSGNMMNWAYFPELSLQRAWPLKENLCYANPVLLTAGMGGFPLGDLYRWFPEEYARWKVQAEAENERISYWLDTGRDSLFTVVEEKSGSTILSGFTLSQNYPNPFNPLTRIKYSIPQSGAVSLKVYNLLGEEIATLFEGVRQPGDYEATFNGMHLAGGVYFCRLKTANFVKTKKLILLK